MFYPKETRNIRSCVEGEQQMEREGELKALDAAIKSELEKAYGKGAVMKLGDPAAQMNVETIPTGSLSLDIAPGTWRNP